MYGFERGKSRHNTDRPLYWEGMVGLMYPSDYGYAAGNSCVKDTTLYNYGVGCKNKDWLFISNTYQWLMSPRSNNSNYVFRIGSVGQVNNYYGYNVHAVRPTFYLTSSSSISSGNGSMDSPYILG